MPSTLPVLPLKETVVFPQSMTPLAIGQERSIKLVDDVAIGDRMLALVTVKQRGRRDARLGRPARRRHGRDRAQADPDPRRHAADPRPGRAPDPPRAARPGRAVPRRRVRRGAGGGRGVEGAGGADAQRPEPVRQHHRRAPVPARGAADRRREHRRPDRPLIPGRLDDAPQDRREAAAARDRERRGAPARDLGDPQPRARGDRARLEDPVAGPVGDGEGPARVLPRASS